MVWTIDMNSDGVVVPLKFGQCRAPTGSRIDAFVTWSRGLCDKGTESLRAGPCRRFAEITYPPVSVSTRVSEVRAVPSRGVRYEFTRNSKRVEWHVYAEEGRRTEPSSPTGQRRSLEPDGAYSAAKYREFLAAMRLKSRTVHRDLPQTPLERDIEHKRQKHAAHNAWFESPDKPPAPSLPEEDPTRLS